MTDSQWERAFNLYEAAAGLPPDRAWDKLNSLSNDPDVVDEVMAMLATLNRDEPAIAEDSPASKSGLRIGRYEVMELLGCGATGDVYKGRDSELGRPVALKFMTVEFAALDSGARRFLREAQAASALNHPNIITVHEVIAHESSPVIVMELVDGQPLREACRHPFAPAQVLALGSQILRALAAAHASGIVHRDLKPENVMVRQDGYVKVLDFGLARQTAAAARSHHHSSNLGLPVGTLRYMSPEQCRGETATPASDIFAAGLVLYEMSTGRHPFQMDSPLDTAHAIAWTEPVPANKLNSAVPVELNAAILGMLAKDPARRPSAAEVLRGLAPLSSDPVPDQRRSRLAMVAAAVLAAVGLGYTAWRFTRLPKPPAAFEQLTRLSPENRVTASAIAPDGQRLAYADLDGGVYVRDVEGPNQRTVFRLPTGRIDTIAWMPGSGMAGPGSLLLTARDLAGDSYQIWTLELAAQSAKRLPLSGRWAAPSPDGRRIAYLSPNAAELWTADSDGRNARWLIVTRAAGSLRNVVWSPQGKWLHYWNVKPEKSHLDGVETFLNSVDVNTGLDVPQQELDVHSTPFLLPDGRLLYARSKNELWETRIDPSSGRLVGERRMLTRSAANLDKDISASADGRRITALAYLAEGPYVYVGDLHPPSPRVLNPRRLTLEDSEDYPHAWTPDGKAVVFESKRRKSFDIFTHSLDRRSADPLVVMPGEQVMPMVSPDGRWILFLSTVPGTILRDRQWNLMRVPVGGGAVEQVPTGGPIEEFACQYKASRCVIRKQEGLQAIFYDLDPIKGKGRELTRVAVDFNVFGDWTLSPDGTMIALTSVTKIPPIIRVVYLDRSPLEREIPINGPPPRGGAAVWTPDGRGFYLVVGDHQMRLIDWDGRNRFVHEVSRWAVPSPDGKHMAFLDVPWDHNVWLLKR